MLRVGLTGGIGAGKSAVAARLGHLGAVVVDADALAREVVAPGTEGLAEVVAAFGEGVLQADGSLDRAALASVVFGSDDERGRLEAITHPRVAARMAELVAGAEGRADQVLVYDVPLLVEKRMSGGFPVVVVVEAPREVRLTRLADRGVSRADAEARMAVQATDEQRRALATAVLDNSGDLAALHRQVDALWGSWRP